MKWLPVLFLGASVTLGSESTSVFPYGSTVLRAWDSAAHPIVSKRGKQALEINPEQWQHLQSEHFVLHFTHRDVAVRTAQEAEFYLDRITEALEVDKPEKTDKSHIFIFENEPDWKTFTKNAVIDPWTGGFFDGLDLFYRRKTGLGVLHSDSTLPHEITHRVLYTKYPSGSIPLALNEGFAEYQARKLAFRYLRPRGYKVHVLSKQVTRDKFLSAEKLIAATRYPSDTESVEAFYDESERLVHMLMDKHGLGKFRQLLEALAVRESFQAALLKVYSEDYRSLDQFERVFEEYAIEEKK